LRPGFFIVILLSMISYLIVDGRIIKPQSNSKYELQQLILTGQEETQQQYSVLTPAVTYAMQKLIGVIVINNAKARLYSFEIVAFFSFLAFYFILYFYLRLNFDEKQSMIGLLLFQSVIMLLIQNVYTEPAIFNLTFFAAGLLIIAMKKDFLLPLVIMLGSLNQPQILALLLFYMIYQFSSGNLMKLRSSVIVLTSLASWLLVENILKSFYGLRPETSPGQLDLVNIPMFILMLGILVVMSFKSLFKGDMIFKFSILFTPLYILLALMLMPQATLLDLSPVLLFIIPAGLYRFSDSQIKA
jgi:hypothetical protein